MQFNEKSMDVKILDIKCNWIVMQNENAEDNNRN